jgi:hypothetical protein
MKNRVFLSYEAAERSTLDTVAHWVADAGFGVSGRDYTRDELFVVGSTLQQLQAATVAVVLVTPGSAGSKAIAQEIAWAIEQNVGIVGLRLDKNAAVPESLFDAGAEVLDAGQTADLAYLPRAMDAAVRSAKLLEQAAQRGSGTGAPCRRPARPS